MIQSCEGRIIHHGHRLLGIRQVECDIQLTLCLLTFLGILKYIQHKITFKPFSSCNKQITTETIGSAFK